MLQVVSTLKKLPLLARFGLVLFFALVVWLLFWLLSRPIAPENAFWQAVDNNLNNRSLTIRTVISTDLPQSSHKTLADSWLQLNFAPQTAFHWQRSSLTYDRDITRFFSDPAQLDADFADSPEREWYDQESYGFNNSVYVRHDYRVQPEQSNWRDNFSDIFTALPLGSQWHRQESAALHPAELQHFMMASLTNGGILLHGKLGPLERARVMASLREAYLVDFDNVRNVKRDGRLVYEYDLEINWAAFGRAFVDYFNANTVVDGRRLNLTDEEVANIFRPASDNTYTVSVDTLSQQIVEVNHPLMIAGGLSYEVVADGNFSVTPYWSYLINDLVFYVGADIRVKTEFFNRDQVNDLRPPAEAVELTSGAE